MTDDAWECISLEIEEGSYVDTFVCPICNALVKNHEQHSRWHIDNLDTGNYVYTIEAEQIIWVPRGDIV